MKHCYPLQKLLLVLVLFFISIESKAQFVTIPDANFVAYLQTNFPSAMSGNQMDTTDFAITSASGVDVSNLGISDMTGIQYFTTLIDLVCGSNNLSTLPPLPADIDDLDISGNLFTTLPNLPLNLTILNASFNQITGISSLPSNIVTLNASFNQITVISSLPASLESITLNDNPNLSILPILPPFIFDLNVGNCNLSLLPSLPMGLITLACSANNISCLPYLPDGLWELYASGNPVNCLPNIPNNGNFTSDIGTTLCNGMQSNFNGTPVSCFGFCDGDLVAVSTSGTALDYAWSNGFNDLNNASGASGISGLCAGNYSVTITPTGGGCVTELSTTVNQPTQQQLGQPTINPMSCLDDSTWVYFPGNPPFTFQWSNGAVNDSVYLPVGTYTVDRKSVV